MSTAQDEGKRRFTVHWVAQRQERRSAPLTEAEAQKFLAKLTAENAEEPSIREHAGGTMLPSTWRDG